MSLTLAQLIAPDSIATLRTKLLGSLQGLGVPIKTNNAGGDGGIALSGVPDGSYDVVLTITSSGGGTGNWSIAFNGSVSTGTWTVGSTASLGHGISATFNAGTSGAATSFMAADAFSFSIALPSFPVTSWASGGVARTFLEALAQALSSLENLIGSIASGGFLNLATADWLDLVGVNVYSLTRNAAVATVGNLLLTDAKSAGPFTIAVGQLVAVSSSGLRYINTAGGTLTKGGTLSLAFQAESPGASYNVGLSTITTLATPLPGVTATNPDGGSGDWKTTTGTDAETDAAYRARCSNRWSALGTGATAAAYRLWATTAAPTVTRVNVYEDATVPGQVDIVCASSTGASTGPEVTAVQAYVDPLAPLCVVPHASAAVEVTVAVTATLYVAAAYASGATVAATAALQAFLATIPIGGTVLGTAVSPPPGKSGVVSASKIEAVLSDLTGVVDLTISLPSTDTWLAAGEVGKLGVVTLTIVSV